MLRQLLTLRYNRRYSEAALARCYPALLVALLTSLSLFGQTQPNVPTSAGPASNSAKTPRGADESCALPGVPAVRINEVVDAAYALQPPLAVDALIRVAEKISSRCPALAKDLLQHPFDLAASVNPETAYTLGTDAG